jgi:hypothetical protein
MKKRHRQATAVERGAAGLPADIALVCLRTASPAPAPASAPRPWFASGVKGHGHIARQSLRQIPLLEALHTAGRQNPPKMCRLGMYMLKQFKNCLYILFDSHFYNLLLLFETRASIFI